MVAKNEREHASQWTTIVSIVSKNSCSECRVNMDKKTQEFGPNGAALNSDTMTEPLRQAYLREGAKAKAWRKRVLIYVPLGIATVAANEIFGFETVFPVLIALCVVVMLYQRFNNRRSWDSILWGLESPKDR
jgi:hypothetical protein